MKFEIFGLKAAIFRRRDENLIRKETQNLQKLRTYVT